MQRALEKRCGTENETEAKTTRGTSFHAHLPSPKSIPRRESNSQRGRRIILGDPAPNLKPGSLLAMRDAGWTGQGRGRSEARAAISVARSSTMRVTTPKTIATSARLKSGTVFDVTEPTCRKSRPEP